MTRSRESDKRPSFFAAASTVAIVVGLVALILVAFGSTFLTVHDTRNKARNDFRQAQRTVRETEDARALLESRIESLRTHVDAVRLQARNEFRLIMPGERIEVIAIERTSGLPEQIVATTLP